MRTKLGIFFGGQSVEHEVSVISALQAVEHLSREKYEITLVYIHKNGRMYTGEALGDIQYYKNMPALVEKCRRVILTEEGGRYYLKSYPFTLFGVYSKELDMAFPITHGTNVEDGALQGYFQTIGIPYVGSDVASSAVGMDKYVMKCLLKELGLPVLPALRLGRSAQEDMEAALSAVEQAFAYPVVVKPANLGSSVGISLAKDRQALEDALDLAFAYAAQAIVEPAVANLREINCSVLGYGQEARASECEEPIQGLSGDGQGILSYADKYMGGSGRGKMGGKMPPSLPDGSGGAKSQAAKGAAGSGSEGGMASLARLIPAPIDEELRERIRDMAVQAFLGLGCGGVARIDFLMDGGTGQVYFNEINTIPGSLAFYLWEPLGLSYGALLDEMIRLAWKRQQDRQKTTFALESNLLDRSSALGSKAKLG